MAIAATAPKSLISEARIQSARSHAQRSAGYEETKRVRRLLPESRSALIKAAQKTCPCCSGGDCGARLRSLPASCHLVYDGVRTMAARGYAGVRISGKQLSKWLSLPVRTVWWALAKLRALRLISHTANWEDREYVNARTRKKYEKIRVENTYALGSAAPQRVFKPRTPVQESGNLAQGTPVQQLRSHSPHPSGRGRRPTAAASPVGVVALAGARGPVGPEGAANRRTIAPSGAEVVLSDEERADAASFKASLDLSFLDDGPGRALRAAEKGEVAR